MSVAWSCSVGFGTLGSCFLHAVLDLPGIIEGAAQGRGRGRQVVAVAKTADLILMMLDITKSDAQRRLLEIELEAVGIRLNQKRPDVVFKPKTGGGITINTTSVLRLNIAFSRTNRADSPAVYGQGAPNQN